MVSFELNGCLVVMGRHSEEFETQKSPFLMISCIAGIARIALRRLTRLPLDPCPDRLSNATGNHLSHHPTSKHRQMRNRPQTQIQKVVDLNVQLR